MKIEANKNGGNSLARMEASNRAEEILKQAIAANKKTKEQLDAVETAGDDCLEGADAAALALKKKEKETERELMKLAVAEAKELAG